MGCPAAFRVSTIAAVLTLDGERLTVEDVKEVAVNNNAQVAIHARARDRMAHAFDLVTSLTAAESPVYGVNTGVGLLANTRLSSTDLAQLQLNVIRSHAAGCGPPLPTDVVRGMMLIRANVLAKGLSGVRVEVAETLCQLLNRGVTPVVPSRGSVGASGDLAPLAHIALVLVGEGQAELDGTIYSGKEALRSAGIQALTLAPKEGISLVNGTQAMLAIGVLQLKALEDILASVDIASALTVRALAGRADAFDQRIHAARPHRGQVFTASVMRSLLMNGEDSVPASRTHRVQDAYSLRCIPQVHGAVRDAIAYAKTVLEVELNSATDNPLVFHDQVLSGGNFHGSPLALALDFAAIALCQLAGISERRIERLVNPALNDGLPAFLAVQPGLESGLMMAQVTAAALLAELRVLSTPASVVSIPTSGNQEDFVSMGMTAALKLSDAVKLTRQVIAIEALAAARALQFRTIPATGDILDRAYSLLIEACDLPSRDQELTRLIERADEFIASGKLTSLQKECPPRCSNVAAGHDPVA
jgi:histidine ammonia-lyase